MSLLGTGGGLAGFAERCGRGRLFRGEEKEEEGEEEEARGREEVELCSCCCSGMLRGTLRFTKLLEFFGGSLGGRAGGSPGVDTVLPRLEGDDDEDDEDDIPFSKGEGEGGALPAPGELPVPLSLSGVSDCCSPPGSVVRLVCL